MYKCYTSLVKFIPKDFILFGSIKNGIVFLIEFSGYILSHWGAESVGTDSQGAVHQLGVPCPQAPRVALCLRHWTVNGSGQLPAWSANLRAYLSLHLLPSPEQEAKPRMPVGATVGDGRASSWVSCGEERLHPSRKVHLCGMAVGVTSILWSHWNARVYLSWKLILPQLWQPAFIAEPPVSTPVTHNGCSVGFFECVHLKSPWLDTSKLSLISPLFPFLQQLSQPIHSNIAWGTAK